MAFGTPGIAPGVLGYKSVTRVLLLGPYKPTESLGVLEALRECLRRNGYVLAEIVRDIPYREIKNGEAPDSYFLEKSKNIISNWAQVVIFVFPSNCDYAGVIIEFDYMLYEAGWLRDTSAAFFEKKDLEKTSLMLRGQVTFFPRLWPQNADNINSDEEDE